MLKFLIADDHPLYREALIAALQNNFENARYYESECLDSTINTLKKYRATSVVLLDLNMPDCENYYGLLKVRQRFPDTPTVVVSSSDSPEVVSQAMQFGASAFVPKSSKTPDLVSAIKTVLDGGKWLPSEYEDKSLAVNSEVIDVSEQVRRLTPKQFKVLRLVRKGLMNKDIATELNVTEATVKAHIGSLFKQFDVKSRTQILIKIEKLQLD